MRTKMLLAALAVVAVAAPAGAAPLAPPSMEGPDLPTIGAPLYTVTAFENERYTCTEGARTATIAVPQGDWDRIVLATTITPDGDPWDRVFGVGIGGVEVLRGTTPRTSMTLRKDVTEYASLLPPGGTATVSMYMGTYVGSLLGTVRLEFYATEQTERLVRAPAAAVVGGPRWHYIGGDGARATSTSTFPAEAPATATIELTLSGHGQGGEFWYLENPVPRAFHVLVDGTEVAVARALPYVYALAGTGNGCANGECGCGAYGTTSTGQRLHAAAWWTGQQALDVAGVHTGDGEIPPYRVDLDAASLATLTGARTVEVVQEGGSGNWLTSLTFLLR